MGAPVLPPPERLARKHYRWTYADLDAMPESLDRIEILDGDLVVSPSPHLHRHQTTVGNLFALLRAWVKPRKLGRVFVAPADVVRSEKRVLPPDVFYVRADRLGAVGRALHGPPDLVAEVLSPGNDRLDQTVKFRMYEEAGVPECWIVDPKKGTVEGFALGPDGYARHDAGARGAAVRSALLDGLSVNVDDVFDDAL